MPIARVQMPDGRIARLEVPEGTKPEEVEAFVSQQLPQQQPQQQADTPAETLPQQQSPEQPQTRTFGQEIGRQLGLTGRAAVTGLTALPATLADLPVRLANLAGAGLPLPSAEQQKLMTRAGLPEPETTTEQIGQFGATVLAGAGDPISRALQAALPQAPGAAKQLTEKSKTLREAQEHGYRITPTEAQAGVGSRAMQGLAGQAQIRGEMSLRNQVATDQLARKALGLPEDAPLTTQTLENLRRNAYEEGYAPITKLGKITTGSVYRTALDDVMQKFQGMSRSFPEAARPEVANLVESYRVKSFDAGDAIDAIRSLRQSAADNFKTGDTQLAQAQKSIAKAIEDNIELNLKTAGPTELLKRFKDARTLMAKSFAVDDALVEGMGSVNALKMAAKLQAGEPLTGELRTIGKFASAFPQSAVLPKGGEPTPVTMTDYLVGGGGGAFLHPGLLTFPAIRYGARELMTSGPYQRMMTKPSAGLMSRQGAAVPSVYQGLFGGEQYQRCIAIIRRIRQDRIFRR